MPLKIIFAGTPEFAVPALAALIADGHEIKAVLTQPDRPAGRGMQLKTSPVKQLALQHHLTVLQPEHLKAPETQAQIAAMQADVLIVAAYGLIIPTAVLAMFAKGSYNIHGSLLPRWRGAAPIHRAILAGDAETGVTIMQVVPKLDAGAMISKFTCPITENDTTQSLHDIISAEGAKLMAAAMRDLAQNGYLPAETQDETLVTYAHKLDKTECPIDWQASALALARQVRAFNPFPVATAQFKQQTVKIWLAKVAQTPLSSNQKNGKAGEILATQPQLLIQCGEGILEIIELQMPNGKRQNAQQFVQGQHVQAGDFFS